MKTANCRQHLQERLLESQQQNSKAQHICPHQRSQHLVDQPQQTIIAMDLQLLLRTGTIGLMVHGRTCLDQVHIPLEKLPQHPSMLMMHLTTEFSIPVMLIILFESFCHVDNVEDKKYNKTNSCLFTYLSFELFRFFMNNFFI